MYEARPDILSFDATEDLELFFAERHAIEFIRQGGTVAYGLIPTSRELASLDAVAIFSRWLAAASLAGDPPELAQRAMITATCGLGLLDMAAVTDSFRLAHSVGKLVRSLAAG